MPAWVYATEIYTSNSRLNVTSRNVHQAIANRCHADSAGNLVGAFGSRGIARDAGVGVDTFWRHVKRLERLGGGLVVCLARGGVHGAERDGPKRILSNTWGIPAAAGSLDHLRARRREQTMRPTGSHDSRGHAIHAPVVITHGDQVQLWRTQRQLSPQQGGYSPPGNIGAAAPSPPDSQPQQRFDDQQFRRPPPPNQTTPVCGADDPHLAGRHHHDHDHRRASCGSTMGAPPTKGHGEGTARPAAQLRGRGRTGTKPSNAVGGPCLGHIDDAAVFEDFDALYELFRRERARGSLGAGSIRLRGGNGTERCDAVAWRQFAAAALRTVQVIAAEGGIPGALFASLVNQRQWIFISEAQWAEADRLLEVRDQRAKRRSFVEACVNLAQERGLQPYTVARQFERAEGRELTPERWEAMQWQV